MTKQRELFSSESTIGHRLSRDVQDIVSTIGALDNGITRLRLPYRPVRPGSLRLYLPVGDMISCGNTQRASHKIEWAWDNSCGVLIRHGLVVGKIDYVTGVLQVTEELPDDVLADYDYDVTA